MAIMLFVDVCGDTVPFFSHSKWNGISLADFVMPGFLFTIGASMNVSIYRGMRTHDEISIFKASLSRCLRLFIVGILVQGQWLPAPDSSKQDVGFDIERVRIMGILQRISICSVILMATVLFVRRLSRQIMTVSICTMVQILVLEFICVPGCAECSDFSVACNAESYLDRMLLGANHLYRPLLGYDPEGLVSTLGCVLPCFVGYISQLPGLKPLRVRAVLSCILVLIGLGLEEAGIPLNKALWTPSYNLVTCGTVVLAFSLLENSAVSENNRNPLGQLGCNAILFYILSDCCGTLSFLIDSIWVIRNGKKVTLISWFKDSILLTDEYPWTIVFYAALQLLAFFALMRYLYEKRIFIKI